MNMYLAIVALTTVTASFISVALGADPATLARQLVQPWQAANVDCSCRPLTGGLSNVLWLCSADTPKVHPQHVVVRQYHLSGALLDRDREQRVAKYLADQGIAPRIYGMQGDTRVEQYINGTSLGKDFGTKPTLMVTAELLANFHKVVPGPVVVGDGSASDARATESILHQIDKWVGHAVQGSGRPVEELLAAKAVFDSLLRPAIQRCRSPIVFCHNDAQEGNILRTHEGRYVLIDYEYASWNYAAYDLANAFCESALDNNPAAGSSTTGFLVRPELAPTLDTEIHVARSYLSTFHGRTPSQDEVRALISEIALFKPASHLLWAAWGLVQASDGVSVDFDYKAYAMARLDTFYHDVVPLTLVNRDA
ncbi:Aminoglycoside phosphotransferase domain-containing protein [Plasmodiophora brassicae]